MRTTTGGNRRGVLFLPLLAVLTPPVAVAGGQGRKQTAYALIAGTVFREDGLSLPGARVVLEPQGEACRSRRLKKQEAVSDARGEFAFRVPPVACEYRLMAGAPGFESRNKQVRIEGEERIDVFLRLPKASKQ